MRQSLVCCAVLAASVAFGLAPAAAQNANLEALEEQAFKEAAALVGPSLVRIDTFGGLDQIAKGVAGGAPGTGIIVSADGDIVSSTFLFASKPASVLATLADGRRFPARVVATDRQRMVTLLKIDANGLPVPQAAPRSAMRVGQWALALGRSVDADQPTISVGVISALDRVWGKAIQTDAKVSPLNYGGPLVDVSGRILGVLAPLSPHESGEAAGVEWYDSGIGFAVPLADVLAVLPRLKEGEDLRPGLFGVTFRQRDQVGAAPLIDRVRFGSPAAKAGLKAGDLITRVDGQAVTRIAEMRQVLGRKYAGDSLQLQARRGEETLDVALTLVGELAPYEAGFLGVTPLRSATQPGATVRFVWPDSPAEKAGIEARDRIVRWNDQEVANSAALADIVSRLRPGEQGELVVRRGAEERSVSVTLAAQPDSVPPELPAEAQEAPAAQVEPAPKTGRLAETLAGHDRDYWLYVPGNYRPDVPHGLMVFLHPAGETLEAALLKNWQAECERRGVIILAPKCERQTGWISNDLEFVKDCVQHIRERYTIAKDRIWAHGVATGGPFATFVAVRERSLFRGLAVFQSPIGGAIPENDPDSRLQFFLGCGQADPKAKAVKASATALRQARFPVVLTQWSELVASAYPAEEVVEELSRWADGLDRI